MSHLLLSSEKQLLWFCTNDVAITRTPFIPNSIHEHPITPVVITSQGIPTFCLPSITSDATLKTIPSEPVIDIKFTSAYDIYLTNQGYLYFQDRDGDGYEHKEPITPPDNSVIIQIAVTQHDYYHVCELYILTSTGKVFNYISGSWDELTFPQAVIGLSSGDSYVYFHYLSGDYKCL